MALTTSQAASLKASIQADATVSAAVAAADWTTVSNNYNLPASPQVLTWRPSIPVVELMNVIDWTAGTDGFLVLTATKQNAYMAMTQGGFVDATQPNIRAGFSAIFNASVVTSLAAVAQVPASKFQALFVSSGVCAVFGQALSPLDVQRAMGF